MECFRLVNSGGSKALMECCRWQWRQLRRMACKELVTVVMGYHTQPPRTGIVQRVSFYFQELRIGSMLGVGPRAQSTTHDFLKRFYV